MLKLWSCTSPLQRTQKIILGPNVLPGAPQIFFGPRPCSSENRHWLSLVCCNNWEQGPHKSLVFQYFEDFHRSTASLNFGFIWLHWLYFINHSA